MSGKFPLRLVTKNSPPLVFGLSWHWFSTQVATSGCMGRRSTGLACFAYFGFAGCENFVSENCWNRGLNLFWDVIPCHPFNYWSWDCNSNFTSYPSGDTCFRSPFPNLGIAISVQQCPFFFMTYWIRLPMFANPFHIQFGMYTLGIPYWSLQFHFISIPGIQITDRCNLIPYPVWEYRLPILGLQVHVIYLILYGYIDI